MTDTKVQLASPEWYALASKILTEVAQEFGEEGFELSVCEVFVGAPKEVEEQAKNPSPPEDPNLAIEGDMERLPPWIIEFHNRLAPYTA